MSIIEVLDLVKSTMRARGAREFRGIARRFRIFADGDGYIDRAEFADGLQEMGLDLSSDHIDGLLAFFDKNGDGKISLDEFLVGIRGQLNTKRQASVDKAFLTFDKTCDGVVDAADLKGHFSVAKHPKFQSGEMTEDEIFMEFLANFGDKNGDGKIERSEFNDYYSAVSADIDNDDYFVLMIHQAWGLSME